MPIVMIPGMKPWLEVARPALENMPHHSRPREREPEDGDQYPRAGQSVLPQQLEHSAQSIVKEAPRNEHHHHAARPPPPPSAPVARDAQPGIEGDRLMLDLLKAVPAPELRDLRIGAVHMMRVRKHLISENGSDVLERHRADQTRDRTLFAKQRNPLCGPILECLDLISRLDDTAIEPKMFARMRDLLLDECFDLGLELRSEER